MYGVEKLFEKHIAFTAGIRHCGTFIRKRSQPEKLDLILIGAKLVNATSNEGKHGHTGRKFRGETVDNENAKLNGPKK